jgi:hypothetical protein
MTERKTKEERKASSREKYLRREKKDDNERKSDENTHPKLEHVVFDFDQEHPEC